MTDHPPETPPGWSLSRLSPGQTGRVLEIVGDDPISCRVLEMGMTPGVVVKMVGRAPLGDPLEFELRGYRLSLRRDEAERVRIEPPAIG
ncbi:FeoA family protein [Isosphaera pallida ATCC 43644]|uniref:FeoA family protein n=1 Tax=Isosphaera pallida (strain ATCC 43644 / DSM 9630 / IS1B) TaxID=575540 RepID=E8R210_ISOPI|nr:ferrous iron transport protein A [Isosphaera pallida]ADV62442.1 FeoA family protein [Isosphaera pallida ATCC 43644]